MTKQAKLKVIAIVERAAWTFGQAWVAAFAVADVSDGRSLKIAASAAAISAVKSTLLTLRGVPAPADLNGHEGGAE